MQDDETARCEEERPVREEATSAGESPPSDGTAPRGKPEAVFRVTAASLAYRYLFIGLLTLVGAVILYAVAPTYVSTQDLIVMIILGIWALALLRYWVYLLDMPHKVICREDGTLAFFSVFRRRVIPAEAVLSMKVSSLYPTYLKFRTARKKRIVMINHVDGLHHLVNRIRKANPDLQTKGC